MNRRTSRIFGWMDQDPELSRRIETPEGVAVPIERAHLGSRMLAFIIDFMVILGLWFAIYLPSVLLMSFSGGTAAALIGAILVVVTFALFLWYFTWFEMRWQGRTVGKRCLGLRVADARGGALTHEAIFARNLTRYLELWIPAAVFVQSLILSVGDNQPWWVPWLAAGWIFGFAAMPVFNRSRMRVGDMIGGTIVVVTPAMRILPDVATERFEGTRRRGYRFTDEQLDIYGNYELQVLEGLLRQQRPDRRTLNDVARRIKRKLKWPRHLGRIQTREFLQDFYVAQRARLEQKMLLGRRQDRKRR